MPDAPLPSRLSLLRHPLLGRFGAGGTVLLAVMAALLVTAIAFAIEAEKPWGRTVQKRLQKKEALQPEEYAIIGLWWAAVANAGVLAVLLGTAGKWMPDGRTTVHGQGSTIPETAKSQPGYLPQKWILPLVLGAVVWGAWERWPKLSQSFWNDEAYSLNRFVHGAWKKQKDGAMTFKPVTWTDTLFENRNGNNHLLNSFAARVSLDTWRSLTGKPPEAFSEAVGRLPHFLAGLGTIFMMFLLGREIGSPLVGAAAAWLMALHPWHIRYAVEMRGYALMLFFLALGLFALVRALRTDRLRWWLLMGACETLYLLSFPGALYVALVVNAMAALEIWRTREWRRMGSLLAFNALAAVPVLQWMLPSIPQILNWLKEGHAEYVTDVWQWLQDLGSVFAVGWQYDNPRREFHVGTDWKGVVVDFLIPPAAVSIILAGLFIIGLVLAFRRGAATRIIVVAPVLAALVSLAANLRPGSPMTVWYLIYLLIPATLAVHLTLERAGRWRNLRWLPLALCAWFTLRYHMGTATAVGALRQHDRQPIREAVAFIRAQSQQAMTATFSVSDRQNAAYDPGVEVLESAANLESCVARSRAASQPLYVYFCSDFQGQQRRPEIYERLVKSGEFERVTEFPGSEEMYSYFIYRLKPEPRS